MYARQEFAAAAAAARVDVFYPIRLLTVRVCIAFSIACCLELKSAKHQWMASCCSEVLVAVVNIFLVYGKHRLAYEFAPHVVSAVMITVV